MAFHAVFLRGINIGGVRIAMKDLQAALVAAGFTRVATLLASGNVVLEAESGDPALVKERVESALRSAFGYDAWVIAKSPDELGRIVEGYPFTAPDDGIARHSYVILTTGPDAVQQVLDGCPSFSAEERVQAVGDVLYWEVPRGSTLDTALARTLAKPRFKPLVTTRNMNTMHKVLAKLPAD